MPWSSSWFHSASSRGAACSRFAVTRCPPCAVKSAAWRGPTEKPNVASASGEALAALLGQRQAVDTGDLADDRVRDVALP